MIRNVERELKKIIFSLSNSLLFSVTKQYILQTYPTCVVDRLLHSQYCFICIVSSILYFFLITLFLYNFKLTEKLQEYRWKFCVPFTLIHYLHFSLFTLLSLHLQSTVSFAITQYMHF